MILKSFRTNSAMIISRVKLLYRDKPTESDQSR